MIPPLDRTTGLLPPGIHTATWDELATRFGYNAQRQMLLAGLRRALTVLVHDQPTHLGMSARPAHRGPALIPSRWPESALGAAGCHTVYIDGSFVTDKKVPADFDACWEIDGVNLAYLAAQAPMLLHPLQMRAAQLDAFGGEMFPARITANRAGTPFLAYFQYDTRSGQAKGIVALKLETLP